MPDAHAGSYTVTYSGGQSVSVGVNVKGGTYTQPYSGTYGGAAATSWAVAGNSATCSGPIKATATWQSGGPGDNPPATVVVVETGTATWSGTGVLVPTGSCTDGLKDAEVDTTTPPLQPGPPTKVSGVSQGVHYSIKSNPGLSFPLTPTPNATVSCAVTQGGGNASVSYSAAVYPVFVTPGGAIQDSSGTYNILVGQLCIASLNSLPGTVSNYQWGVTGTTFQTWQPQTPAIPPAAFNPLASYYVDGPGRSDQSSAAWYWNDFGPKPTSETISCSATVTPPSGQGSPFTVSATKQVTVWRPGWGAWGTGGMLQVNTALNGGSASCFYAGPTPGSGETSGMDWLATVSSANPALFGVGNLALLQLVTPDRSYTALNWLHLTSTNTWSQNGQQGLDGNYPYPGFGLPSYFSGDSPNMAVTSLQALSAQMDEQFEDYLMYYPPGSVQCVPLARFLWTTNGSVTIPGTGNWANFGTGSAGTVTPSGGMVKVFALQYISDVGGDHWFFIWQLLTRDIDQRH